MPIITAAKKLIFFAIRYPMAKYDGTLVQRRNPAERSSAKLVLGAGTLFFGLWYSTHSAIGATVGTDKNHSVSFIFPHEAACIFRTEDIVVNYLDPKYCPLSLFYYGNGAKFSGGRLLFFGFELVPYLTGICGRLLLCPENLEDSPPPSVTTVGDRVWQFRHSCYDCGDFFNDRGTSSEICDLEFYHTFAVIVFNDPCDVGYKRMGLFKVGEGSLGDISLDLRSVSVCQGCVSGSSAGVSRSYRNSQGGSAVSGLPFRVGSCMFKRLSSDFQSSASVHYSPIGGLPKEEGRKPETKSRDKESTGKSGYPPVWIRIPVALFLGLGSNSLMAFGLGYLDGKRRRLRAAFIGAGIASFLSGCGLMLSLGFSVTWNWWI